MINPWLDGLGWRFQLEIRKLKALKHIKNLSAWRLWWNQVGQEINRLIEVLHRVIVDNISKLLHEEHRILGSWSAVCGHGHFKTGINDRE